jgi:hypothetical protein
MKQEMTVNDNPEGVLGWTESKLIREFPNRAGVGRPLTSPNVVQATENYGLFPATALGWIFNLVMLAITLGSWIVVYGLWLAVKLGEPRKAVVVTANPDEWGEVVQGWLAQRYPAASLASGGEEG